MDFDRDYAMLIGGKLDGGSARFDVLNPATEQAIGSAPEATPGDLDANRSLDAGAHGDENRLSHCTPPVTTPVAWFLSRARMA